MTLCLPERVPVCRSWSLRPRETFLGLLTQTALEGSAETRLFRSHTGPTRGKSSDVTTGTDVTGQRQRKIRTPSSVSSTETSKIWFVSVGNYLSFLFDCINPRIFPHPHAVPSRCMVQHSGQVRRFDVPVGRRRRADLGVYGGSLTVVVLPRFVNIELTPDDPLTHPPEQ